LVIARLSTLSAEYCRQICDVDHFFAVMDSTKIPVSSLAKQADLYPNVAKAGG
jgi:hypothetical protein